MIVADSPIMIFQLGNQQPILARVISIIDRDGTPWVKAVSGDVEINVHPVAVCDLSDILRARLLINLHFELGHA